MLIRAVLIVLVSLCFIPNSHAAQTDVNVPILLYHRFGPTVADGMTMKTTVFEEHLKYLKDDLVAVILQVLEMLFKYRCLHGHAVCHGRTEPVIQENRHVHICLGCMGIRDKAKGNKDNQDCAD